MARILIIDDETAFRRVMAEALRKKGHEVHEAANTAEGFRSTINLQPQLIISDVCMEGGDGLSLLKTLRADRRTCTIPFIVMTGHPDMEGMLTGVECAADGYLPKPFKISTLLAAVENRLGREKALRDSAEEIKEQLERILEASPDLIGIIHPETFQFQFLNPAGRALLEIPQSTPLSSLSIQDLHSPASAEMLRSVAIPTALREELWAGENTLRALDGREIPVKQFFQAHRDQSGQVAFLSTIAHDLSESKAAEAALRASEAKFRSLVDSLPEVVLMHDESGRIVFSNARAGQVFGYQSEELRGQPAGQLLCEDIASLPEKSHFETRCRRKSGEEFPADLFTNRLAINGEASRLSIIRDLSNQRKLERERQNIELQLRQALKLESIGQLAAGIAHEINTPTQYIGDNTRFLQDAFQSLATLLPKYQAVCEAARKGAVAPEMLDEVETAAATADLQYLTREIPLAIQQSLEGVDRVTKLVRAMKDFSHPGVTEKTMSDINHLIESTVTVARNEWKYVADMETRFDPNLPPVLCLPGEFNQVILNIVVNAAHAIADVVGDGSNGKGRITITTRKFGSDVEIRIQDTGTGIPEKIRDKIFEPFFTTKEVGRGTGQGLAISRSVIVDKHNGTLDFETQEGKGTTFIIRLPVSPA